MILTIIGLLETLAINLFHTHFFVKNRYSNRITFSVLLLFTIVLFTTVFFIGFTPGTSVLNVLFGSIYLIPLYFLYEVKFKKLLTIMVYCWTYSMAVTSFAFGIISSIYVLDIIIYTIILQTLIFIATLPFVLRFSKNRFKLVLQKSKKLTSNLLLVLVISVFTSIVTIRYYISPDIFIYFMMLFSSVIISVTSYVLIYTIVQSDIELTRANIVVHKDPLTGIKNRYSLFKDMTSKITENKIFSVLFMDLDNLKGINDTFGHNKGDDYLKEFSSIISKVVNKEGFAYRFAGDEFICLVNNIPTKTEIESIENTIKTEMSKIFEFNGVSIGMSSYPLNGDTVDKLIDYADESMYGEKRSKKIRR